MLWHQLRRNPALSLLLFFIVGILLLTLIPIPKGISHTNGDTTINFSVNHAFILTRNTCVQASWQAENIREIFFMESPTVGEDSAEVCFDSDNGTKTSIQVRLPDDSLEIYTLETYVAIENPVIIGVTIVLLIWSTAPLFPSSVIEFIQRGLTVSLVWIIVLALMLEVGFRIYLRFTASPQERLIYTGTMDEIERGLSSLLIEQPFLNYGPNPQNDANRFGFRSDEITLEKPDGVYRIATLGGSTTYGWGVSRDEAWPNQLGTILREEYGYNVEVINGGVPSYISQNSLINFQFRILELDPDLVIVFHGGNDASIPLVTSVDCFHGENPNIGLGLWYRIPEYSENLLPGAFPRFLQIRAGFVANLGVLQLASPEGCDPNDGNDYETRFEVNRPHDYFLRNITTLIAIAQTHDVDVMLSTWSSFEPQPEHAESFAFPIPKMHPFYLDLLDEYNEGLRAYAPEIPVVDFDADFSYDPAYWQSDTVHKTVAGHRAQAELFATFIVEQEIIED